LDYTELRYGGGYGATATVSDNGGELTLTNSLVRNSYTAGLRIATSSPTVSGVTFKDSYGVAVSMDLASHPTVTNVSATNNQVNGLVLDGGTLTGNAFWDNPAIVYQIAATITVPQGKTLTVAPGQVIKVPYGNNNLVVSGTLKAAGTAAAPVIFTSYRDDSAGGDTNNDGTSMGANGDWGSIQFSNTSTASVLDHTEVRYSGGWGNVAAVVDTGAPFTLTNSALRNSYSNALTARSNATVQVGSTLIARNSDTGIRAETGSVLSVFNNTIDANTMECRQTRPR
jgi:hypothetical protein